MKLLNSKIYILIFSVINLVIQCNSNDTFTNKTEINNDFVINSTIDEFKLLNKGVVTFINENLNDTIQGMITI